MTLDNDDRAKRRKSTSNESYPPLPEGDQDIRNHPLYKTPWWRKTLKPYVFWIIIAVAAAIVVTAVILSLSLGIALF
ncbi:hypothetical protein B7R22_06275 [Subtercola boreus]|uniref:Uncharacterized protein n=1 Tax=Subtercola boreus TaxID=120213 RepID=A0A3E0W298_9MICO|nr:hypothetical protein [Subtercola boreus]RFA15688.1 hypothetical protein B7R22_06275 [Subtercola boreus]